MIDYQEEVKKIIEKQFGLEEGSIEDDSFLEADLNITELDLEDLIAVLEDKYQITVPQDDYSKFKQVSDIATYLYEHTDQA
ncbi:acyl carrier protein [Candidatus Curtissbacteria bacterium]|nr:acyl carrier protein [Candidatus Curtissbacteria bacterium]